MTSTRHKVAPILVGAVLLSAFASGPAPAQDAKDEKKDVTFSLSAGGQYRQHLRTFDSKFQEYREVPRGAIIEAARLDWTPSGKPWSLTLSGRNVLRLDQAYTLDFSRPGTLVLKGSWARIPHYYASGATSLYEGRPGDYTISNAFRQAVETAAETSIPALQALMAEALANSGQAIDLRARRDIARGEAVFKLGEGVDLTVNARHQKRSGSRAIDMGTYIRRQAIAGVPGTGPGFFDAERIESRILEVPEPLDHRSTDVGASLGFSRKRGSFAAGWEGSWFRNRVSTLYWNNPFEAFPSVASSTIGLAPQFDQEPSAPNGNNTLRGRYARSALDLWPDNTFNRFFASGSLKLGDKTRMNATVSRGRMRQDDPFLPYGESEAVVFSGTAGSGTEVLARNAPLAASNLDGKIDTTRAEIKLSSHPTDPFHLRAAYRYYDYDDKSAQVFWPGYVSSGDSYFRRGIGQTLSGQKALFNTPGGYKRRVATGGTSYRFGTSFTLEGDYSRTQWDYDIRQVLKNVEDTFKLGARIRPSDTVTLRLSWLDGRREFDGPFAPGLENTGIRQWDVWNRDRTRFSGEADFDIGEHWTVGGSFAYWKDEYPGLPAAFTQPYGASDTKNGSVSGSITYGRGDWSFGASAGFDSSEWNSLQVTKSTPTAVTNDPTNRWSRGLDDDVLWLGLNLSGAPSKKTKLSAELSYNDYKGDWTTINLGSPNINSAIAYPFPQFKESLFTARVSLRWEVTSSMDFEARYWFEPYRLDDFTWDSLQPYLQGIIQETGGSPTEIRDANVSRTLLLNSRYSDYTGHVVSALIHVRF